MEYEEFRIKMDNMITEMGKEEFFTHFGNYVWREHGYLCEEAC